LNEDKIHLQGTLNGRVVFLVAMTSICMLLHA